MGVIDRVVDRLVDLGLPMERAVLEPAAAVIAAEEAPLERATAASAAVDALVGLGPVQALLDDAAVSDVLVNGPADVWVERGGHLEAASAGFADAAEIVAVVERAITPMGLRLDAASPAVDARLPDGSRLHAIIPPASVDGPVIAVRRFTDAVPDLAALVARGAITTDGAALLADAIRRRLTLLVSGGTGAGKTTLLNVLSREIPAGERVVTVEDAAELRLSGHVVRLEARPANTEGAGEITLRALVRHALRLRPDRIVVGEVRGPEAFDLIQAMNTGHDGSMSTVHANSPEEALLRVESLAATAGHGVTEGTLRATLRRAVDLVVQVQRSGTARQVASVVEVAPVGLREVYAC